MADVEKTMLASEVDVLRNMNHPYIVKYYGHILDKKTLTLYIITEYCKEGDLQSLIRKNRMNRYQKKLFTAIYIYIYILVKI